MSLIENASDLKNNSRKLIGVYWTQHLLASQIGTKPGCPSSTQGPVTQDYKCHTTKKDSRESKCAAPIVEELKQQLICACAQAKIDSTCFLKQQIY